MASASTRASSRREVLSSQGGVMGPMTSVCLNSMRLQHGDAEENNDDGINVALYLCCATHNLNYAPTPSGDDRFVDM